MFSKLIFFLAKISTLTITLEVTDDGIAWWCIEFVEFPSRDETSIGRARGFRRLYLSPLHPASGFLRQTRTCRNHAPARTCNCSGNDKADSVATLEVHGDAKTESEWEGKASFYGALNSDEVARPILPAWGGEDDPNYPGTDKQTADEAEDGGNIGEDRKG